MNNPVIEEWNNEADEYNQWDMLSGEEKEELYINKLIRLQIELERARKKNDK